MTDAVAYRSAPATRSALERMQRTTYFATGLAAALFTALLASGPNGFLAQMDQLRVPFGVFTVAVGVAIPASYTVLAWVLKMSTLRWLVTASAAGFMASQILWVPMMTGDALNDGAAPWLQGFGALHATLLVVAWNRPWVWLFAVAQLPLVATVEFVASGGNLEQSMLDGLGALVTSLILTGAGAGVVTAAALQDREAAHAQAEAAHEASLRTEQREQARINALVHDQIMSVLLASVRTPTAAAVPEQAQQALASVAAIRGGARTRASAYSPPDLVAVLRATASDICDDVAVTADVGAAQEAGVRVPGGVVAALAEATGEALRNSAIHAGSPANSADAVVRSIAVSVTGTGARVDVRVTVCDDGRGFVPRNVPARRLGLQVSIRGRMAALVGGGSRVTSAPGQGTVVDLWWRPEGGS